MYVLCFLSIACKLCLHPPELLQIEVATNCHACYTFLPHAGFFQRGWGSIRPLDSGLLPEIFFHMSSGKILNALNKIIILLALSSKSYNFGVVRIKHARYSFWGAAPPDSLLASLYSDSLFQVSATY